MAQYERGIKDRIMNIDIQLSKLEGMFMKGEYPFQDLHPYEGDDEYGTYEDIVFDKVDDLTRSITTLIVEAQKLLDGEYEFDELCEWEFPELF